MFHLGVKITFRMKHFQKNSVLYLIIAHKNELSKIRIAIVRIEYKYAEIDELLVIDEQSFAKKY